MAKRRGSFLFAGGGAKERPPGKGSRISGPPKGGPWSRGYNYANDVVSDETRPANDREPLSGGGWPSGKYWAGDKLGPQYQGREPLYRGGGAEYHGGYEGKPAAGWSGGHDPANDVITDEPGGDTEPLAGGGEALSNEEKLAGHELMSALGVSGGLDGDRNKKVGEVVRALKSLFMIFDAGEGPEEAPEEPPGGGEEGPE